MAVNTAGGPRGIAASNSGWKIKRGKRKGQGKCRLKEVFPGR